MARDDPEQVSYFALDPDEPPPPAKDVVIAPKDDDPGGVGDGGRTPGPEARDIELEGVRHGDKRPEPRRSERAPPPPPRETPRANPQEGIDELKAQLDRESETRRRAEQAAAQAMQRAQIAEARAGQATSGMIDSAIDAAVQASNQAAAKFAAAMDVSDHKTAGQAQIEIADARTNLHRLQEQKQMLQDEAERLKRAPQPQPQQGDQRDVNLRNITTELERTGYRRSADWLRSHPDMVRDRDAINKVDGAHGYVVNVLKVPIESDRYFDEMESILLDGQDIREPEPRQSRQQYRQPRPAAPTRSQAPRLRDGQTRRTVHLSSEQRQHARDVLGMSDEEYAAELALAEDSGKLLRMNR